MLTAGEEQVLRPQPRYLLLAVVGLALSGAFLWSLSAPLRAGEPLALASLVGGEGFFAAVTLAMTVWFGRQALARVTLTAKTVTLQLPLARPHTVEFRQLMSVSESGRGGNALILLYHPPTMDGLLDLDDVRSLVLPAIEHQEDVREFLEARLPV